MTDYTGFSLQDILEHIENWIHGTTQTLERLQSQLLEVDQLEGDLEDPGEVR